VELGKKVASGILRDIATGNADDVDLDPATWASLAEYLEFRSEPR
jgi:hypothetical protein